MLPLASRAVARKIRRTGVRTLRTVAIEIAVMNKITIVVTVAIRLRLLRSYFFDVVSSGASLPGAVASTIGGCDGSESKVGMGSGSARASTEGFFDSGAAAMGVDR